MKNTTLTPDQKRAEKLYFALYVLFIASCLAAGTIINALLY